MKSRFSFLAELQPTKVIFTYTIEIKKSLIGSEVVPVHHYFVFAEAAYINEPWPALVWALINRLDESHLDNDPAKVMER